MAVLPVQQAFASLENPQLLPTPPMGFNNWARFECDLNQTLFTETADAMVSRGLLKAGYDRVNIDDCWPLYERAQNGSLQWNETLFPNGLPWLGNYLKQRGFHFGIYSDAGNETCGGYPGSLGYEEIDAKTFASWGIDYLKLDGCNVYPKPGQSDEERYQEIYSHWHDIFSHSENPLIFSESAPAYFAGEDNLTDWYTVMDWVPVYGELARHSQDVVVHKSSKRPWNSVMANYDQEVRLAREQGVGYYNDPDFLIADEPELTFEEKKSHFALWSSLSAPLIISAYIPDLPEETIEYLTNENFIAVDQDKLALQATLVSHDGTWDVLAKSLSNGDRLVTILNNGSSTGTIEVPLSRIGYAGSSQRGWWPGPGSNLQVKDLWTGKVSSLSAQGRNAAIKATVPSHGTASYRISARQGPRPYGSSSAGSLWTPTGIIFNADSFHCLTSRNGKLSWTTCDASDGQVWRVGKNGATIKPLSNSNECLAPSGGQATLGPCRGGSQWKYDRTGNIRSTANSNSCLTEGSDGSVVVQACGRLEDSQVFDIPSGWQL
ncbi:carbohydrate-binding module family 13 protein [Zasmidium cellare ATCC 36951]|uniref:Alpha-galactosidase n=1 Tax=Zasmidium cellare ATCC 36951 TaxID=1080233 RepID=A0A6A6CA20_ZASCE|nr:carbohydrate-binding module family 13 protein [Zasmidium cellare ATCC 36951]KAF2163875.1 carbohydrate-binding module family 13 protein [Zasmidium cellare ATCC 36951]